MKMIRNRPTFDRGFGQKIDHSSLDRSTQVLRMDAMQEIRDKGTIQIACLRKRMNFRSYKIKRQSIKGLGTGQTCFIVNVSPAVKVDFEPGQFVLLVDESGPPVSLFLHQSDLDAVVPHLVGAFLFVHWEVELQDEVVV